MRNSKLKISVLTLISLLLSFTIMFTYGYSITAVYGIMELLIAMSCYLGFFHRFRKVDPTLRMLCLFVVGITWISGIFSGDLKSTLLITVPLIMPLYISTFNIEYKSSKDFVFVTSAAVILTFLAIMRGAFGYFNSNSLGFMGFMGISFGFIWVKTAHSKIIPIVCVFWGILCASMSGSRNVVLVGLICVMLLLLPDAILKNRIFYYSITGIVLIFTIFSADIMAWGFSIPKVSDFLFDFTSNYSQKAWSMVSRVDYLRMIEEHISQRGIIVQLFGTGTLTIHGHNMFYQCVLEFGYIGTTLIYLMFFIIFRQAYILIRKNHDQIALGCAIALWGNFMLQAADVYLLGPETYAIVPQVLIGIILQRYSTYQTGLVYVSREEGNSSDTVTY